ncbi:hypothetical protein, conserved [Eimeria tenella]|uniref:Uncharacterized protein n=1 Tax=Eimeria tenella TaxID=5802 RepID=U6L745_EIMTE|nr:hypothetical protein, conserved [Eimeria tenella]CDJ45018.1 hypothetical protein, conserved [Eimeria tenella]|eukprot:XP_013235765.1 hypothetical protein, conserved [Eimeria tenella]
MGPRRLLRLFVGPPARALGTLIALHLYPVGAHTWRDPSEGAAVSLEAPQLSAAEAGAASSASAALRAAQEVPTGAVTGGEPSRGESVSSSSAEAAGGNAAEADAGSSGEEDGDSEWMVRWADEEGKELLEVFTFVSDEPKSSEEMLPRATSTLAVAAAAAAAPPAIAQTARFISLPPRPARGILVGAPPGPQSINWEKLFAIWDNDEDHWTPGGPAVGLLSDFQELKKALPPKYIYGVVLLALLASVLSNPIAAAKNAKIAAKRREVAGAKREAQAIAERIQQLKEDVQTAAAETKALAARLVERKVCLDSMLDLRAGVHQNLQGSLGATAERATSRGSWSPTGGSWACSGSKHGLEETQKAPSTIRFGPDWGLLSNPIEFRLKMAREWGDCQSFVSLELSRVVKALAAEVEWPAGAPDKEAKATAAAGADAAPAAAGAGAGQLQGEPLCTSESAEEIRRFLSSARSLLQSLSISSNSGSSEGSASVVPTVRRGKQLLLYGLLLQQQQELERELQRQQVQRKLLSSGLSFDRTNLAQHRQRMQTSISMYLKAARDAMTLELDGDISSDAITIVEQQAKSINLEVLNQLAEALHHPSNSNAPDKLVDPVAHALQHIAEALPSTVALEARLGAILAEVRGSESPEQQLAASELTDASGRIRTKREQMIKVLKEALADFAAAAIDAAVQQQKTKMFADAAASAAETLSSVRMLVAKARKEALQT